VIADSTGFTSGVRDPSTKSSTNCASSIIKKRSAGKSESAVRWWSVCLTQEVEEEHRGGNSSEGATAVPMRM